MAITCISSLLSDIICYSHRHHNTYISLQELALKKKGIFLSCSNVSPDIHFEKSKASVSLTLWSADCRSEKGFVLNETSTFLWNVLQHHEGAEPHQLAEILARTYHLDEAYLPELLKDVTDFLTQLTAMGMITEDLHLISSIPSVSMIIAGICIKLYGSAELISPNFKPFYHEFSDDDTSQEIELVTAPPPSRCYGQVLLQNSEMTVFENPDRYVVLFPQMQNLYEAHMLKDGTYVRIYCHPQVSETNIENLFHAIRLFFPFHSTKKRTVCNPLSFCSLSGKSMAVFRSFRMGNVLYENQSAVKVIREEIDRLRCSMKNKLQLIWKHLRQGTLQKMAANALDLSIRKTLLKSMILYTLFGITGSLRFSGFQSDFQGSGRHYHRASDRKAALHLCCNDRFFRSQYPGFTGFRICLHLHQP